MKENILKKEFRKRDVDRIRNIMTGDADSRVTQGIGYSKGQVHRSEGDIWEEDGRRWTIKEGIRQNITRLDKAKSALKPMFCPKCSNIMNNKLDDLFFKQHTQCYSCVLDFETSIKQKGLWNEYQSRIQNEDIDNFVKDYTLYVKSKLEESNMGFVTEAGDVERWIGSVDKTKVLSNLNDTIKYLESFKK